MKERGLLLTDIMALRAWEKYKTQTRHPVKGKALELFKSLSLSYNSIPPELWSGLLDLCPWGVPGDRIYVREAWWSNKKDWVSADFFFHRAGHIYWSGCKKDFKWRPNIHMPRDFARTVADVTYTGIERIQDITDEDCMAEGIQRRIHPLGMIEYGGVRQNKDGSFFWTGTPKDAFRDLWDSIYSDWEENPVVWVNHFKKI